MMSENGRMIVRTKSLYVLDARQAESLFAQLRRCKIQLANHQDTNHALHERVRGVSNLLMRALHELALAQGKEPQSFIRTWLEQHEGGEARERA